jgi:hypothetical protein
VIALAGLMQIVPAHDRDAYNGIPYLPARPSSVANADAAHRPR